jgi:hypothetical protein
MIHQKIRDRRIPFHIPSVTKTHSKVRNLTRTEIRTPQAKTGKTQEEIKTHWNEQLPFNFNYNRPYPRKPLTRGKLHVGRRSLQASAYYSAYFTCYKTTHYFASGMVTHSPHSI